MKALYAIFALMINEYEFIWNHEGPEEIKQKWGTVLEIHPPIGIHVHQR